METKGGIGMVNLDNQSNTQAAHLSGQSVGIRLSEIFQNSLRLEASAYALEARQAVAELKACPYPLKTLLGDNGFSEHAHNAFRFARIYVSADKGIPFLSSSDIIGLRPERDKYLSPKIPKIHDLKLKPWEVLISCSGTIGNVSVASPRMAEWAVSQHVIRVSVNDADTAGFVAAFLRTKWGRDQLTGMTYGSVIQHIEPIHLKHILIPDLPAIRRIAIGRAFVDAALKRDEANYKLDKADAELRTSLKLPPLPKTIQGFEANTVKLSQWGTRLDAAFHNPTARWVEEQLKATGFPILPLSDKRLTNAIQAVTKFRKRVYVPKGGIPLLSSKQLFQIDPIEIKGLAKGAHEEDMDEIALTENMLAITCSGTIGRIQIIPKYMQGWAANQHALRVISESPVTSGFLYAWLSSDYGQAVVSRYSYGSVIVELDRFMLRQVPVPFLTEKQRDHIGNLVLDANTLRHEAWELEQDALKKLKNEIEIR